MVSLEIENGVRGGYLCLSLVEVEIGSNDEDKEVEVSDIPIINVHIDGKVYFESLYLNT